MILGKFYNVKSVIHEIDARLKFLFLIWFSIGIFFVNKICLYIGILFLILLLIKLSRVPFKLFFKNVKSILPMIIFTSMLNIFFITRGKIVFKFFFVKVTDYAFELTFMMILRITVMLFFSLLIILTTSTDKLSRAIIYFLLPFKKVLPINEIAMILNIALRFIPVLSDEFNLILKAQKSRKTDFDDKRILVKAKNYLSVLIPVFILSFKRADDLALAMESRCYNPDNNTKINLKKIKLKKIDFYALAFFIFIHVIILVCSFMLN